MSAPLLPVSAPFSSAQRAWLNGFFAGMMGNAQDVSPVAAPSVSTVATAAAPSAPPATAAEEEMPWHDATLSLDERMKLAEGKPPARKLMAAMAQLDCGSCGYVCQFYAEAIANGSEKNLTLCSPGGKETSKKLKELVTTLSISAKPVAKDVVAEAAAPGVAGPKKYDRLHPYPARLMKNVKLNAEGSGKDTRLIVLTLRGSGITYEVGDALGVYPENDPETVDALLEALHASGAEDVQGRDGDPTSLRDALLKDYAVTRPSEDLLYLLSTSCTNDGEALAIKAVLADGAATEALLEGHEILDLLHKYPSARPPVADFVATLAPMQPRLYSISSSMKAHPHEVHLTIGVVRYANKAGRNAKGVASCHLAERVRPGMRVRVFVHPAHKFHVPKDPAAPMIMVGPGTGIAPFRAFLEERKATGATGKNWLFFGDQKKDCDFLYRDELEQYLADGLLTRLDLAFSRDQKEKVYVQHRMIEQGAELWEWLSAGGCFYVCGDAKRMAADVDAALHRVVAEHGKMSAEEAAAYVQQMAKDHRYLRDVY